MAHHFLEGLHISQQDVPVDIGQDHVKDTADMRQYALVAFENLYLHAVDLSIVLGVAHAPVVNVVGYDLGGSAFGCDNAQDARTASAVEHALVVQVKVEQGADNHLCGLVGTGAEGLPGINGDEERSRGKGGWLRGDGGWGLGIVDNAFFTDDDGLESLLLPGFVPVFVFHLREVVGDGDLG